MQLFILFEVIIRKCKVFSNKIAFQKVVNFNRPPSIIWWPWIETIYRYKFVGDLRCGFVAGSFHFFFLSPASVIWGNDNFFRKAASCFSNWSWPWRVPISFPISISSLFHLHVFQLCCFERSPYKIYLRVFLSFICRTYPSLRSAQHSC